MLLRLVYFSTVLLLAGCMAADAQVISHIGVTTGISTWSYMVYDDELTGSPNYIGYFTLSVNAPVQVTGTPVGWTYDTDGSSYVSWHNTDLALPYPHDIAPGSSLGGFSIESTVTTSALSGYDLSSWDHTQDAPGPDAVGSVLAPDAPTPVPEISTWQSLGALLLLGGLVAVRRRPHGKRE